MNIQMIGIDHNLASISCREIFSFTKNACKLSVTLQQKLSKTYESCISYTMKKETAQTVIQSMQLLLSD